MRFHLFSNLIYLVIAILAVGLFVTFYYASSSVSTYKRITVKRTPHDANSYKSFQPPPYRRKEFDDLTDAEKSALVNASLTRSKKLLAGIHRRCRLLDVEPLKWSYSKYRLPRLLIYKKSIKLLYSSNPKTGSSSFKMFFFKVDGVEDPHGVLNSRGHYVKANFTLLPSEDEFRANLIIGAIRNPAIRLISGFRDKVLRKHQMLKKLKEEDTSISDFELFKRFLELGYYNTTQNKWFVSNLHFRPQWNKMLVCSFPYDLLIQYENGNMDIDAMQIITNTTHIQYNPSRKSKGIDTHSSSDIAYEWLSQLDQEHLDIIYNVYALDYYILGYTKWGEAEFPFIKSD